MRRSFTAWLGVGLVLLCLRGQGWDETRPAGKRGSRAVLRAVEQLGSGAHLAARARDRRSVVTMLAAMEMLGEVRYRPDAQRFGKKESQGPAVAAVAATDPVRLELEVLAQEARGWAGSDTNLLQLIEATVARIRRENPGTLGASGGPIYHSDRVAPRHVDTFKVRYVGDEPARVEIVGDGLADLNLVVLDEAGREVCRDMEVSDRCRGEWVPPRTGIYRIQVVNREDNPSTYVLATN